MNERILIIEDDQAILKLLQRGLAYEGYTVDTAIDGRQQAMRDHPARRCSCRPARCATHAPTSASRAACRAAVA